MPHAALDLTLRQVNDAGVPTLQLVSQTGEVAASQATAATSGVSVTGSDQPALLTVDLSSAFSVPVEFDGGALSAGGENVLQVRGGGQNVASYLPEAHSPGSGQVVVDGTPITFTGLQPVDISDVASLTVTTPGDTNVVAIDNPGAGQLRISGTSDGVAFEEVTFSNVPVVTLDTGANRTSSGTDTVAIESPLVASGLQNLTIQSGPGADQLALGVSDVKPPGTNVIATYDAGLGINTIRGPPGDAVWNILGTNQGTIADVTFASVQNLVGGTGNNSYVFADGSGLSGGIAGGGGNNTLDYSAYTSPVTVNLALGEATGAASITQIQRVIGGAAANTLIGPDTDTEWTLTGPDTGTVGSVSFDSFENLVGGAGQDTFRFEAGGSLSGLLDGGTGNNTLIGADTANTWTITGPNTGTLNGQAFTNIENLTGGAGPDTFIFKVGGSLSGQLDGGPGFDTLAIDGGKYQTVVFAPTGPGSGTVSLDGNKISYSDLEPISNTGTAANIVFDLASGDQAIIENPGSGLQIRSLNSTFETTTFSIPTGSLTINQPQGGTDSVEVHNNLIMPSASLNINAASITVDPGVTIDTTSGGGVGDITLTADATSTGGPVPNQGLLANANSLISLTGATLAGGALTLTADSEVTVNSDGTAIPGVTGSVITSFSSAKIDIGSASHLTGTGIMLKAKVGGNLTADASNNTVKLVAVAGDADPEVLIHGSSNLTATGKLDATAASDVTINATTKPTTNSDSSIDAAVVSTTFDSGATLEVSDGADLNATGAVTLLASSKLNATTTADANVASTAGAAVAVSVVTGDTTASIASATVDGSSVSLSATSDRTITTTAKSSPGGSSASGSGSNQSEKTLASNSSATDNGSGSVTFAGAVAVNTDIGTTQAFIQDGTINAGPGGVTVTATPKDVVSVLADGEFTGDTSSTTNGVGVAVAIDVVDRNTLAYISGITDITAGSLSVGVGKIDAGTLVAPDQSTFTTQSIGGVGSSSSFSFAGSVAVNVVITDNRAYIDDGATLTLHGNPDVTIAAHSNIANTTKALPEGAATANTGIGASVAFAYGEDRTAAYLGDNVALTGAHKLGLTADSAHTTNTQAKNGAAAGGGTAVTPVVAISVTDDAAYATLGSGGLLTVGGDFKASSSLKNAVQTKAEGNTKAGTGVGVSIALSIVNDSSLATTGRDLAVLAGAAAFLSSAVSGSETTATASVAGAQGKSTNSGGSVDDKKKAQQDYADKTSQKGAAKFPFNASTAVDTTKDTINLGTQAGLSNGDAVVYKAGSGNTAIGGLTDGTTYYVRSVGAGKYKLYQTAGQAQNNINPIHLSSAGTGTQELDRQAKGSQGAQSPPASTSDGSVDVAAAVAVNVEIATSTASIPDGRHITATGMVTVQSAANADGHAIADGSAATTNSGDSIGAAVAVNVNTITNLAYVGDNTVTSGSGLTVGVGMADRTITAPVRAPPVVTTDTDTTPDNPFAKDSIFVGLDAGLKSGDQVAYYNNGNTSIGGLTSDITGLTQSYYVNVGKDGTVRFYDTKAHAEAGGDTGLVKLTSTGSGTEQWLGKFVTVSSVSAPNFLTPIKFNPTGTVPLLNLGDSSMLRTGDAVKYDAGGGTAMGGLTDGTIYYVIDLTGGHYQLAASRDDAYNGKAIALTDNGNTVQKVHDDSHSSRADASSGASGGDVGVAGSVAVNVVLNDTEAMVGVTPDGKGDAPNTYGPSTASVTITGGGNVSISTASDEANLSSAKPHGDSDGDNAGVGASVAVNVPINTVYGAIIDGTSWSGTAGTFTVSATSGDSAVTHGENGAGAANGTAVGVGVAVLVALDTTMAYVGTTSAPLAVVQATGDVGISASHTGAFKTDTGADAAGKNVGVGASVSVAVAIENVSAELARSIATTGGAFTLSSTATVSNDAEAVATVKGADKSGKSSDNGSTQNSADGQANHQVNDNTNTKSKTTLSSSAGSSATTGENKTSSEGSTDQSGVGVAAAVSVNVLISDNTAKVTHGASVTAHNTVTIGAYAEDAAIAKGIGAAVAMDNSTNIGAGVGLNVVNATNKALVTGASTIQGNGITIEAITPASKTDDFIAWGAAAATSTGNNATASIAGSVGINVVNKFDTEASAASGSHLESSGDINVTAIANLDPQTLAAAAGFSKTGTAFGATITVTELNASTLAYIAGDADEIGALTIDAEDHLLPTKIDIPKVPDAAKPSATSVAVAGSASKNDPAIAGSFIINDFHVDADAHIGANSKINQAGLYTPSSGQTISVAAVNETKITSIAGALGATLGSSGIGIGLDVEILHKTTFAYIGAGAQVNAGGAVSVTADSRETMLSITGTVGVGDSAGIAASISIADIHPETDAYIADPTAVESGGAVTLSATSTFKTTMIAGAVGVGSTAGIGVANTTLVHSATTQAYIGGGATVTAAGTLSITATASEDLLSIAAGVAGSKGSASVAGSAVVNVLTETTSAYVGPSATITTTNGGDLKVDASDTTSVISVAGSIAASLEVGVGVGADVGVFTKHTNAYIDSGVTAHVAGNITVDAESSEKLISVSAGLGAGTVGVAANAGVHVFDLTTRAFIGDDPNNPSGAGPGDVHATGSVVVSANDLTDINEITAVLAAGEVGVGAAAGVDVMTKDTEAFIGAGAKVTGDGNGAGLTVNTGRINTGLNTGAPTFNAGSPSGVGIETSSSSTLTDAENGDRSSLDSQGQVNTPQIGQMDLHNSGSGENVRDDSVSGRRTTSLDTESGFRGVAVAATNQDEIRTFTFSLAAGEVGVAVSAGVDVVNATTQAYIGDNATVNGDTSNASSLQSVLVGAGDDFYHLSVAGSAAGGFVGVGPAVAVNVITNTTNAYIGKQATVNALDDIAVEASSKENVVMIGFGIAAGFVGVGGAVDVLSIDNHTKAYVDDFATVYAGGDVFVSATDDTHVLELSGALAGGFVGVGGSVGVMLISKDTEATIGQGAHVDALGNGAGISGALDGNIVSSKFETTTAHGVIVQAESSEDILHIVAAGAGGFVGVSGAVGVTLISVETDAVIHGNAVINGKHQGLANGDQSVYVNAADDVGVQTFIIGVAGGFVGVSGAVDAGTINNNTKALVEAGAQVTAKQDIEVNAVALKSLQGFDASGAGGFVGVGGAVSVWAIGTQIQKSTQDQNGAPTGSAVDGGGGKVADNNAAGQAESGRNLVTNSSGGGINNFGTDGSGNANTNTNRVNAGTQKAATKVNAKAPKQSDISGMENSAPTPPGTSAVVQPGASLTAGGAISVKANESDTITVIAGQFAGGVVGAGASVAILSIADNVTAFADGTLSAGGNIGVNAILNEEVHVTGLDGATGFAGIGAAVAVINDSSLVQASLGNVTLAGDVTVNASDTRDLHELTGQISAGAVAVGASYSRLNVTGGASSTVDANAQIGQSGTVHSLSVSGKSAITAESEIVAVSAGIGAFGANFAVVNVSPQVGASIGNGAKISVGSATITARAIGDSNATAHGTNAGAVTAGSSEADSTWAPTVMASVGGTLNSTGDITIQAFNNYNDDGSENLSKQAQANATPSHAKSFGLLFGAQGASATTTINSTVDATISSFASVSAGHDLNLTAKSRNNLYADSDATVFGAVSVGNATATGNLTNDVAATTGGGNSGTATQLHAGDNININSFSDNVADVETHASSGLIGLVTVQTATSNFTLNDMTEASIGKFNTVSAGTGAAGGVLTIHALRELNTQTNTDVEVGASGVGTNNANANINETTMTGAGIGQNSTITVNKLDLHAQDDQVSAEGNARAVTALTFANNVTADTELTASFNALAFIGGSTHITATNEVDITSEADNVGTTSSSHAEIGAGITGNVTAYANNTKTTEADIHVDPVVYITTQVLNVLAQGGYQRFDGSGNQIGNVWISDPTTTANTVVQWVADGVKTVCNVIGDIICGIFGCNADEVCNTVTNWVEEAVGGSQNAVSNTGTLTVSNDVSFNADVTILGNTTAILHVDHSGTIVQADGVSATILPAVQLPGAALLGAIDVGDIAPPPLTGHFSINAFGGQITGDTTVHYDVTFGVQLTNDSALNLVVHNISSTNASSPPTFMLVGDDTNFHLTQLTDANVDGVTITNTDAADHADIFLAGEIQNPSGTTTIDNAGGDILVLSANGVVSVGTPEIQTRLVNLDAPNGTIGTLGQPIPLVIQTGGALVSGIQQAAGADGVYLDVTPLTGMTMPADIALSDISSSKGNVDVLVETAQEEISTLQLTPITLTIPIPGGSITLTLGYTVTVVETFVPVGSTVHLSNISAGGDATVHTPTSVSASTDFVLDGAVTAGGTATIATAQGSILEGTDGPGTDVDIAAQAAVLVAGGAGSIGQSATAITPNLLGQLPDSPIETQVGNLEASAGGGLWVVNSGGLQIGGHANAHGLNGLSAASGPIVVVTLDAPVANGAVADTDDSLVVTAGASVVSGGTVALLAGDNFTIDASSAVFAAGNVLIQGDYSNEQQGADPDPGFGSTIQINGPIHAPQVNIWGNEDGDTFNLQILPSPTFVFGVAGNNVVNVSSDAPTDLGTVDAITGPLTIDAGGPGYNTLTISDIGTAFPKTATQTNTQTSPYVVTTLTGLAAGPITYYASGGGNYFGGIFIDGGALGNGFTIAGTQFDVRGVLEITTLNSGQGNDNVLVTETRPHYLVINGEAGNDLIDASATQTPVTIFGGAGNDTIHGGSGGDVIFGDNGVVHTGVIGLNGSEILLGLVKNVALTDAPGTDTITAAGGHNIIIGHDGLVDEVNAGPSMNATFITTTNPQLGGGGDSIAVTGATAGHDTILGGLGPDTIYDAGGNNIIIGHDGAVTVTNGIATLIKTLDPSLGGNDTITSVGGHDTLIGGFGNDVLNENGGATTNNVIIGENGMVTLTPSGQLILVTTTDPQYGGNDTVNGGLGNDTILGGTGNDVLHGGTLGSNIVVGDNGYVQYALVGGVDVPVRIATTDPFYGGSNTITGGAGDDILIGGTGANSITTGDGNDLAIGNNAVVTPAYNADGTRKSTPAGWWERDVLLLDAGTVSGSSGLDAPPTTSAAAASAIGNLEATDIALVVGAYNANGTRHLNADGSWDTRLLQLSLIPDGNNTIVGGNGNDALFGGRGNDSITAGNGNDMLVGGLGNDTLTAGTGKDLLVGDNATILSDGTAGPNVLHGYLLAAPTASPGGGVLLSSPGAVVVPLGFITPGHDYDPLVGVLARLTGGPALTPGGNTLASTDGTTLQIFESVVTDIAHHLGTTTTTACGTIVAGANALLAGNNTLTAGTPAGGTRGDVLVGGDLTILSPSLTLLPAVQTTLAQTVQNLTDAGAAFDAFTHTLHVLAADATRSDADPRAKVVVDHQYSFGNNTLTVLGLGNNVIVGDDMAVIAPTLTVPADQVLSLDQVVVTLRQAQVNVVDGVLELWAAAHDLRVEAGCIDVAHVDQIFAKNDLLVGGAGNDMMVGGDWTQVTPTFVITQPTGPIPAFVDLAEDHPTDARCLGPDPTDQVTLGNDTLVAGGGFDVMIGASVSETDVFIQAGPGVTPAQVAAVTPQVTDTVENAALIEAGDVGQHADVEYMKARRDVVVKSQSPNATTLERGDIEPTLINWAVNFQGFGAAPGTQFPFSPAWVSPIEVEVDLGFGEGDPLLPLV